MLARITKRLVATFVSAAIPNITAGQFLDVSILSSALMSGGVAVFGVLQLLATAYRDGTLTEAEVEEAFEHG